MSPSEVSQDHSHDYVAATVHRQGQASLLLHIKYLQVADGIDVRDGKPLSPASPPPRFTVAYKVINASGAALIPARFPFSPAVMSTTRDSQPH
ncbi:hypothetical protein KC354_g123 [Hortaea werneckii]|nr:hypothetical protein KC354_g123 [Hortaea werneckii]